MSEEWISIVTKTRENVVANVDKVLADHPYLEEYAKKLTNVKREVLNNLDKYVDMTIKAVKRSGGIAHVVKDKHEAQLLVESLCGKEGLVLFAKSNVALELELRETLARSGHEVWETDLGEFLIQLAEDQPSHIVIPALHLSKEDVGRLLRKHLDSTLKPDPSFEELVALVRRFLFEKYLKAKVGITGANSVAAATGTVVLIENEGNIRMDTVMPSIHIAITGVEKIVPTLEDAFLEAQVQSAYAGLYPPTYISAISGPSSTADIESVRVSPATGPSEFHLILVDNGRTKSNEDPDLRDALLCIKCGRCYFSCPVYGVVGPDWVSPPYGGPTGAMWAAVVADDTQPANLCTHSGGCKVVCPVQIDIPKVLEHVKNLDAQKRA